MGTATSREKKSSKRGHEGIEPSTSPTLKENHTTSPMAHAPRSTESLLQLPATPALWFPRASSTAFRAPLAERSAVNRQVLGSIPSGGVLFIFTPRRFLRRLLCAGDRESPQTPWRNGSASDSKSEGWGFDSLWRQRDCSFVLIGVILTVTEHLGPPSAESSTPWRNGSASDSKSEGWGFESLWRQDRPLDLFCVPVAQLDKASDYESEDWGFESLQGYFFYFCARSHGSRGSATVVAAPVV